MEYVLTTSALSKKYGHSTALDGVSMHIPRGAIYGFVGRNGAGKTTLIRVVCGLQQPTQGSYALYGIDCADREIVNARHRVGAVVETPSLYLDMTAEGNLRQQALTLGLPDYESIPELLRMVGLEATRGKRVRNFSLGMKQRLGLAVALMGNPDLLILDEPTNGLDPQGIVELRELILKLNREKQITFLISSHILDELSRLATYYGFIDRGRLLKELSAEELGSICRKCTCVTVSSTAPLPRILDEMGLEYEILSAIEANIYGKLSLTALVMRLAAEQVELLSSHEQDESLENYFIDLVGGAEHE